MSGATSRRKGARAEVAVVNHLRANGFPHAERRIAGMDDDTGDITGIGPGLVLEVKDQKTLSLGAWVDQLGDEMHRADADAGAVIVKRKGVPAERAGEWFAVLTLDDFVLLLRAVGYGEPPE